MKCHARSVKDKKCLIKHFALHYKETYHATFFHNEYKIHLQCNQIKVKRVLCYGLYHHVVFYDHIMQKFICKIFVNFLLLICINFLYNFFNQCA